MNCRDSSRTSCIRTLQQSRSRPVWNSNSRGASPPPLNHGLYAINTTPARRRGVVGSSPLVLAPDSPFDLRTGVDRGRINRGERVLPIITGAGRRGAVRVTRAVRTRRPWCLRRRRSGVSTALMASEAITSCRRRMAPPVRHRRDSQQIRERAGHTTLSHHRVDAGRPC